MLAASLAAAAAPAPAYEQSPYLDAAVAAGKLPPVDKRLPEHPLVLHLKAMGETPGRYGGTLRTVSGREKDVRLMVVYGYARLVAYDRKYQLVPDILEKVDVKDGREFTLHLRAGQRWSDGVPFTAEDFRFYWDDIANDRDLSPFGLPSFLTVDGKGPRFEVLDRYTVRYTWDEPNPFFLPALAGTTPEYIYAPAHYMKKFHPRYRDVKKLNARARAKGRRNWVAEFAAKWRPYKNTNVHLPSLQPWIIATSPPSMRYVFVRNPYFHRVDGQGRQLPYIDRWVMTIADSKLIPAKTGAGESDLQARNLSFSDYTFLKQSEKRTHDQVRLWETTKGSQVALFPNLNVNDPVWRRVVRDVRFRRALSLAINRHEVNQVIYYGLAIEGNDTVYRGGPLYEKRFRTRWTQFDLHHANALLDAMGLDKRDDQGLRLLPDGRTMTIVVETAGEDTEQTDVLELVRDTWRKIGIKLLVKPMQREVFRNRVFSGEALMSVWGGLDNGFPVPDMSPAELAPTTQQQLQWPKWGQYYETGGSAGEPVDLPAARRLLDLNEAWRKAKDTKSRAAIWREMLDIYTNQEFSIGIVSGVPQPVVVNRRLRNVPVKGLYNWEPGAFFGIYHPDTFWFDR